MWHIWPQKSGLLSIPSTSLWVIIFSISVGVWGAALWMRVTLIGEEHISERFMSNLCFPLWPQNCGNSDDGCYGTENILQKSVSQSLHLPCIYCPTFLVPEPRCPLWALFVSCLINVPHAKGWLTAFWLFAREPWPPGGVQAILSGEWFCGTKSTFALFFLPIF